MSDFIEVDFLKINAKTSGDAITVRYKKGGSTTIHVVDGGYHETGDDIIEHIEKYYGRPDVINRVIVTHPDGDHTVGLRKVLEHFKVEELWMLRPWNYAVELLPRFSRFSNADNLKRRLKDIYPNISALEDIAINKRIPIYEPFQGAQLGEFTVLAPSKERYLDLVVESEKTPESKKSEEISLLETINNMLEKVATLVSSAWGEEQFSPHETSAENNMSVIQYANLSGSSVVLTGDAGRSAMNEAADYAPAAGLNLPGVDKIQVPHHGSRRNVDSDVLDRWLGERKEKDCDTSCSAVISCAAQDKRHPKNAVVRGFRHRGASVINNEDATICVSAGEKPNREGWGPATPMDYPEEMEE